MNNDLPIWQYNCLRSPLGDDQRSTFACWEWKRDIMLALTERICVCRLSVEEIEQMTGLFQQKQRELLVAVSRVEELSDQLEVLRNNRLEHPLPPPPHHCNTSTAELERLYKELQVWSQAKRSSELQHGLWLLWLFSRKSALRVLIFSSVDDVDLKLLVNASEQNNTLSMSNLVTPPGFSFQILWMRSSMWP